MSCIIYNKSGGVLRTVHCPAALSLSQAGDDEFVMEGIANDATQKIEFDGFDVDGQPINPRVVDKTLEEIEADNPNPEVPLEEQIVFLTNKQWQEVLGRLEKLEKEA